MENRECVWCGKIIENPRTNRIYHEKCYKKKVKKDKAEWREKHPNCDKEYYQKHKEQIHKQHKQWNKKNKKLIREYQINWAKVNKRKLRKSRKKYRENNREKIRIINQKYFQKNKERCARYTKKWRKENPEKCKQSREKHSHIYRNKFPLKVKARNRSAYHIKIPNGQLCQKCNERPAIERHHKDYTNPLNIIFLCRKCHKEIHKELKEEMLDNLKDAN